MKSLNTQFWWLSHTWDHPDLDCYSQSNNGTCIAATSAQSLSELNQNISVAPSLGITLDRSSLVTPYNSGLENANFVEAAAQLGIQYIVYPQYPATPNTGIVNEFVPSILEITRMNNDLFYDASSPDTGVYGSWPDEYNDQYGPNGATPAYSQNQTYNQILNNLSQEFLQTNMLTYAPYPLAFHIANMASYDGTHSVFSDVMDATITKYRSIFNLPVISLALEDIGTLLKNRASYNASGVVGVYTPGVSIALTTNEAGTIPITGACSQPACGTYGGQIQDNVVMAANSTVTLSLTATSGATLSSVVLNPTSVTSGLSSSGTITLSGVAPAGGLSVTVSSNSAAATVPASVTVAAGSSTASFSVATTSVTSSTSATITVSYNNVSETAVLTITPAANIALSTVTVSPTTVSSGTTATGTVTLASAAPTGGIPVALSSSVTSAAVPSSTTVPAGSTTASFTITATSVAYTTPVTVTASYNGVSKSAAFTIAPSALVALASVSVNPTSVTNQLSATGTVTLNTPAPAGGVVVELWTTGTVAFVPDEVTVPAGTTTSTFTVTTNYTTSTLQDTVTAFYNGASKTAGITVTP